MNSRANTLRAIYYDNPKSVPVFDGTVWEDVELRGNFKYESWTDEWGTVWQMGLDGLVPVDVGHPLADITKIDSYQWPDPWHLVWDDESQRRLTSIDSESMLVLGGHVKFVAERLCCLMGMENFMVAMYDDPDRLQALIDRIVEYNRVCLRRLMDLGVDVLHVSEDLGTQDALMISPEMFYRFLLPAYERCFDEATKRRVIVDFHSCGHIEEIVPDLVAVGVTMLEPVQARANDRRKIKADVMGRTALLGGIDSTVVLTGTVEDVRREVHHAFEILKPHGGWLAGPDQVIVGAPEDNVKVLWDTCHELASY